MSSGEPLVSVVMAVYNGMPYLREAVDSVLAQTFRDFELVIVDDGSTDGTVDCVRSYGDARIRRWLSERNIGQTRALNLGLTMSRGRYIARLDADDVCRPDRLQRQVDVLEGRPEVAVLGTWMHSIDARGNTTALVKREWDDPGTYVGWLLTEVCPVWHPTVMFRREVVAAVGGYDETFRIAQDYDLWIRLALRRRYAWALPAPLVMCREHRGRQTVVHEPLHRQEVALAHERMVGACAGPGEGRRLSLLLRGDDAFWRECRSKTEVGATFVALMSTLRKVEAQLGLSPRACANFRAMIRRRLGRGVSVGAKITGWPDEAFYALVFLLSPLLIPGARRRCRSVRDRLRLLLAHG